MTTDREHLITLLGATGFTGRLVADHLAEQLRREAPDARWAIAGRDPDKLARVADELAARLGEEVRPAIEVVDVTDLDALVAMAARTRVVATTVGPYARVGEPVVEACVLARTHYADITGEPAFVARIRSLFDDAARAAGITLVTCCGFDSVPHDLGVAFTVGHLRSDVPITIRGYVRGQGRLSGGTAASAVNAIAEGARRSTSIRPTPGSAMSAPGARRPVDRVRTAIHRVPQLQAWGVPLPTIDPLIVARSAEVLPGYGTAFRYGHYARVRRLPTVVAGVGAVGAAVALASTTPTRRLLERVLPEPGEGPDEATRARSRFEVVFLASAGGQELMTRVAGGDPGYGETSRMLGQAALSLALDEEPRHPGPDVVDTTGIVTPAIGLGAPYLARLQAMGMTFELLAGEPAIG